jgi:uncharacterized peroxidase-related enzyme
MTELASPQARVPLKEREQVPPEIGALYEALLETRGVVPNMFKALANVPPLALGIAALLKPLMAEGALPVRYKELIAARVAWLNDCDYCVTAHRRLALQQGATEEQLASLLAPGRNAFETGPFTEKEKAGFRYAGLLHGSGNAIDEPAFAAVSLHFGLEEITELTAVAAAFEMFPRFNLALQIPVTPTPEAE